MSNVRIRLAADEPALVLLDDHDITDSVIAARITCTAGGAPMVQLDVIPERLDAEVASAFVIGFDATPRPPRRRRWWRA